MPLKLSPTQVAFNARGDGKFNRPFTEQVDFFRQKLNLPTERFDDILKDAHDRAFVVAGAMKADLLNDLRLAVDRSIAEGKSIQWFRKEFDNIVAKHGWTGWTGEGTNAGRDWRTRVIYRTNLSTSYAAGRWQQLNDPDLLKRRPYWKYIHNDTVMHPRPLHQSWSGMVLRHDDPFWLTHFPPNGWGCRCRVTAVRESEYKGHPAPDDGTYIYKDRAGNEHVLPKGIDYGWDYAPGASLSDSIKPVVAPKVATLPKPLAEALAEDVSAVGKVEKRDVYVASSTIKDAEAFLVANDVVDLADFGKIKDIDLVNQWCETLFNSVKEFPELRKNQLFTGSCQAQYKRWHERATADYISKALLLGYSEDSAAYWAKQKVKKPIVSERWAHSSQRDYVSGIAMNEKYGATAKGVADLHDGLKRSMASGYHPPGSDTIKFIVDHELGHQLDDLLLLHRDREVIDLYKSLQAQGKVEREVSGYARENIREFIAEAWAEFRNNSAPRAVANAIGRIVEARYAARYNG